MSNSGTRTLAYQLAEDLGWLESHCRRSPSQEVHAGQLRLAAALVRNCLSPFLEGQSARPLHLAVIGGAGAGKSTLVNMLCGTSAAESNPQAGFTRHPIAYITRGSSIKLPSQAGFFGPLERLSEPAPSSLDEDVYQVREVQPDEAGAGVLREFMVWDCPDMTTWAASGYVSRLLEVAAMADALVYAASDERYNDLVPTQFLHQLVRMGKPVVVCLMKMRESDMARIIEHFQTEVVKLFSSKPLVCMGIPALTASQLGDPARGAGSYRYSLLNQVTVLAQPPDSTRLHVVAGGRAFLREATEELLWAVRADVEAIDAWRSLTRTGQVAFDDRYSKEYLTSEKFQSFDAALVKLLELLELPGVGKIVSGALWVVRTPYRLLRGWLGKAMSRAEPGSLPEKAVLEAALTAWLDRLRTEAIRRQPSNPLWAHIEEGFQGNLSELASERLAEGMKTFQMSLSGEVESTARAIYTELEAKPILLNSLRTGNLALDVASIAGALTFGHIGVHDFVLVPLVASVKQHLVELLGRQYVESQRERIRARQRMMMTQYVSLPLTEWLSDWPTTGGTHFERLQIALRRIPESIAQLDEALGVALASSEKLGPGNA